MEAPHCLFPLVDFYLRRQLASCRKFAKCHSSYVREITQGRIGWHLNAWSPSGLWTVSWFGHGRTVFHQTVKCHFVSVTGASRCQEWNALMQHDYRGLYSQRRSSCFVGPRLGMFVSVSKICLWRRPPGGKLCLWLEPSVLNIYQLSWFMLMHERITQLTVCCSVTKVKLQLFISLTESIRAAWISRRANRGNSGSRWHLVLSSSKFLSEAVLAETLIGSGRHFTPRRAQPWMWRDDGSSALGRTDLFQIGGDFGETRLFSELRHT